jgi:hypothetical protein
MSAVAAIFEMDEERDRKTCVTLDLKITGANRELAQWLLDHPRYSAAVVAGWIGCGDTRIKDLRRWAANDFSGAPHNSKERQERDNRRHDADAPLQTNNNSEPDDDFDPETGEVKDEVTTPDVIEDNILHAIGGMNENARIFNRLLRASALDREAADRISTAIDRAIGKWRSIQSTLEKKG